MTRALLRTGERLLSLVLPTMEAGACIALVVILGCAPVVAWVLVLLWRRGNRSPSAPNQSYPPQSPYPYNPPPQ